MGRGVEKGEEVEREEGVGEEVARPGT